MGTRQSDKMGPSDAFKHFYLDGSSSPCPKSKPRLPA